MIVNLANRDPQDRKIISISQKRQITIPLKYFKQLNLGSELECFVQNNAIVLRPIHSEQNEFSVEILRDLVAAGLSGEDLIRNFEVECKNIKKAIGHMTNEAKHIASGEIPAAKFDDIFGKDD